MARITLESLAGIKTLFMQPETLGLWGIPYEMRPGQSPGDIWRAQRDYVPPRTGWYGSKQVGLDDWIWLGCPGWYGTMPRVEQVLAIDFSARCWSVHALPQGPNEWTDLREYCLPDSSPSWWGFGEETWEAFVAAHLGDGSYMGRLDTPEWAAFDKGRFGGASERAVASALGGR
jgi:hypothetical protein